MILEDKEVKMGRILVCNGAGKLPSFQHVEPSSTDKDCESASSFDHWIEPSIKNRDFESMGLFGHWD